MLQPYASQANVRPCGGRGNVGRCPPNFLTDTTLEPVLQATGEALRTFTLPGEERRMRPHSFRPKAEAMEGRAAPVILMIVAPLLPLFDIQGISFVNYADPHHADDVRVDSRAPSVSLTLDPNRPR